MEDINNKNAGSQGSYTSKNIQRLVSCSPSTLISTFKKWIRKKKCIGQKLEQFWSVFSLSFYLRYCQYIASNIYEHEGMQIFELFLFANFLHPLTMQCKSILYKKEYYLTPDFDCIPFQTITKFLLFWSEGFATSFGLDIFRAEVRVEIYNPNFFT